MNKRLKEKHRKRSIRLAKQNRHNIPADGYSYRFNKGTLKWERTGWRAREPGYEDYKPFVMPEPLSSFRRIFHMEY